jgi:AbrB family looped-hinge helix DNA binding protein
MTTENHTYEVITQLDTESGDTILPIPPEVLEKLGWKEGDTLNISKDKHGSIIISKESK